METVYAYNKSFATKRDLRMLFHESTVLCSNHVYSHAFYFRKWNSANKLSANTLFKITCLSAAMNQVAILLFCLSFTFSLGENVKDFTPEEYKAIFCTKKLKTIATMTYSPVVCMAEAMGAVLDEKKGKIPKRVSDRFTPAVAKYAVIGELEKFMAWMCKDTPGNMKIINKSHEKNPNLSKKEAEMYSTCLVDEVSETIVEELCDNKNAKAIQIENERVKCMKSFDAAKNCAKEMMSGQAIDSVKIESWACQKEESASRYIAAEMVCYIGNKDIGSKYLQCLNSAVAKAIKN